ncbi:MAG: DUF5723 family protein [Sphingobacteriaceae bacterium]
MKKFALISCLLITLANAGLAQIALNNSRTLFDAFENPSQKAFYTDSSKKFAFNFGFPTLSLSGSVAGSGLAAVKSMLIDQVNNTTTLPLGENKYTRLALNTNIYLLSFRVFKRVRYEQEFGFSWQLRNDIWLKVSNESLAIFDSFTRFADGDYEDIFNNTASEQSYHQFGFSYRENYNKRVGIGAKISFLSGIAYHSGKISNTSLNINSLTNEFYASFTGRFKSTTDGDSDAKILQPNLKNPGFALTASANFKFRKGWFILANVKDLGFIRWHKQSQVYNFQQSVYVDQANLGNAGTRLQDQLTAPFEGVSSTEDPNYKRKAFISPINTKIDFLVNKDYGAYQPNLMLSKNVWNAAGNITLVNNVIIKNHILSISPTYNFLNYADLGVQYQYKTPNCEFYIGSDQLFKTTQLINSSIKSDAELMKGAIGAGIYIGFSTKFGRYMEHPMNTTQIPGLEPPKTEKAGFFRRVTGKK